LGKQSSKCPLYGDTCPFAFPNGAYTMKKTLTVTMFMIIMLFLNTATVEPGTFAQPSSTNSEIFGYICSLLKDARTSDLSFCLGHIRNSKDSNHEIANFILTWSPDAYRKQIPSVFRSKIDRVIKILGTIDYEQLIIDIDLIKNSQLTVSQMVRLIKGTRLYK